MTGLGVNGGKGTGEGQTPQGPVGRAWQAFSLSETARGRG